MHIHLPLLLLACAFLLALAVEPAQAALQMAPIFKSHMVLQRGVKLPIWGKAAPGEMVTVTLGAKTVIVKADAQGAWKANFEPLKTGDPLMIVVKCGNDTITLDDVLVGEVWLCSGQSNMQYALSAASNGPQAVAEANHPQIRLSEGGQWSVCTPDSVKDFSAVGYFFGRALQEKLNVPVGLIDNAVGGSPIETWFSTEALKNDPHLKANILDPWDGYVKAWNSAPEKNKPYPTVGPDYVFAPAHLFEERMRPLAGFPIKGALWYQGESNAWGFNAAGQYEEFLPAMIRDWRVRWGQEFSFIIIQLPCTDGMETPSPLQPSPTSYVQDIQAKVAKTMPKVGLVAITDLGENDIHPTHKLPVGERSALVAQRIAYGDKKVVCYGPTLKSFSVKGNIVRLHMTNTAGGLVTNNGKPLQGFSIAGADRMQFWAQTKIEGDYILVWSDEVKKPASVRYAFSEQTLHNLFNKAGLAAAPFRTDDWSWDTPAREKRVANCIKVTEAPAIDGTLTDPLWARCPAQTGFTIQHTYRASAYATEARLAYDDTNLYVAFRCAEPKLADIVAKGNRTNLWTDDSVEIALDTANDHRTFTRFLVNPAGVVLDGKGFNNDADGIRLMHLGMLGDWRGFAVNPIPAKITVKTAREEGAWTAELAIPWVTLGLQTPTAGASFGVQFTRFHANPAEFSEWITTGRDQNTGAIMPGNRTIQSPARFGQLVLEK